MKTKESDTAKLIRSTELQRKSDASCKQVLKSKWILAFILKDIIPEYERCSLEEIVERYIETDKISEEIPVRDRIEGLDKEDSDMDDATVFLISGFRHCCRTVPEREFIFILMWKHRTGIIQGIRWKRGLFIIWPGCSHHS